MNLAEYRRAQFSHRSESNLQSELSLLDAIHLHEQGKYLSPEHQGAFWQLVDWIEKNKPGLNDLPSEEIGRRFHVRKYEKKRTLKELAFYEVGKRYSKQSDPFCLDDLAFFSEHMEHGFYLGFSISREALSDMVDGIDGRSKEFLMQCRSMNERREVFVEYCQKNLCEEKSDDEIIGMMNPYNGGDYTELPPGVTDLITFILRDRHYDLYAKLLARLYYFPVQGHMLCWLHSVDDGFAIWKELEKLSPERIKVIEYMLRKRILKLLCDQPKYLERNSKNAYITDADKQTGLQLLDEWNKRVNGLACYLLDLSIARFGIGETTVWFSRNRSKISGRELKFVKYETESLDKIEKCLVPQLTLTTELIDGKDLNTLIFYASVATRDKVYDQSLYVALVNAICQHVYGDRYVQPFKLDEPSFQAMRSIYRCILRGGVDGIDVMASYRQSPDGGSSDYSESYRQCMGDSVWLPALILMSEETVDAGHFNKMVGILTSLADYDKNIFNENYFVSFYLAELIVLQVLKGEKDRFEQYLIANVCNLSYVLRILSANEGVLSAENKLLLKDRVASEWEYEKALSQQYKQQTEFLENYLKKLE